MGCNCSGVSNACPIHDAEVLPSHADYGPDPHEMGVCRCTDSTSVEEPTREEVFTAGMLAMLVLLDSNDMIEDDEESVDPVQSVWQRGPQ